MVIYIQLKKTINIIFNAYQGDLMRELNINELASISAGVAMITDTGSIMVTNGTPLFINFLRFYSDGVVKSRWNNPHDFTKDGALYYEGENGNFITATPIEGGFIYSLQNNSGQIEF